MNNISNEQKNKDDSIAKNIDNAIKIAVLVEKAHVLLDNTESTLVFKEEQ